MKFFMETGTIKTFGTLAFCLFYYQYANILKHYWSYNKSDNND